ncbi:MAG: MBL fold metallo-hydrolase [Gammaproteobacteria bacterium]|nr:MBL fold metallo-hydrolase [Gammaproteobacteria bacterium]
MMKRQTAGAVLSVAFAAALGAASAGAQQNFDDVAVQTLQVRDDIYMLVGAGGNITVQTGGDGVLMVDTQYAPLSDRILAAIGELSDEPIRYIVNTHHHGDHTGGNANLRLAGATVAGGNMLGAITDSGVGAQIVAHENVLFRLSSATGDQAVSSDGWPTTTFFGDKKQLFFNGEGIEVIHLPAAHTDGDSIVFFRRSDVISAGDVFNTTIYPVIDMQAGGTVQGIIGALDKIVDLIVPVYGQDGGTLVIPGHGRLSNLGDVLNFREMVIVIRDRVQHMIDEGMSLEQVKAAQPSRDYDPRYGASGGFWTTEDFIEAVYRSLSEQE